MILKRKKINENVVCTYDSSNILASSYNGKANELTITFSYGGQYTYSNVNKNEYLIFEQDKSQGSVFNKLIKPKDFIKGEPVRVEEFLAEIDTMEDSTPSEKAKTELSKEEKQLIINMEAFLIFHKNKQDLVLEDLTDIKYFVDKVIEQKTAKDAKTE